MSQEATALRRTRPGWVLLVSALVGTALSTLECGTQANGPTTVPQAPPAPLEPAITGHFVDEDAAPSSAATDAGAEADGQAGDATTTTPPPADGSVLVAPHASGH